jgi:hypothetical protein
MRVDVARIVNLKLATVYLKNKKLFVNATFLLALCARPYPLPLEVFCLLAVGHRGSSWVMVCMAMLHCTILPAWFAWPAWFVSHCGSFLFYDSQQHTQTLCTRFVGSVCSRERYFQARPKRRAPYIHTSQIFFLVINKTLLTTTHNKVFSICCKALSVGH